MEKIQKKNQELLPLNTNIITSSNQEVNTKLLLHEKDIYPKHPVPATIHLLRGTDSKGVYRSAMEHLARRNYGERWL